MGYSPDPHGHFVIAVQPSRRPNLNIDPDTFTAEEFAALVKKNTEAARGGVFVEVFQNKTRGDSGTAQSVALIYDYRDGSAWSLMRRLTRFEDDWIGHHPGRVSHLKYLWRELQKAQAAFEYRTPYIQDRPPVPRSDGFAPEWTPSGSVLVTDYA